MPETLLHLQDKEGNRWRTVRTYVRHEPFTLTDETHGLPIVLSVSYVGDRPTGVVVTPPFRTLDRYQLERMLSALKALEQWLFRSRADSDAYREHEDE